MRRGLYTSTVPLTTRAPREGEEDGVDYVFVSEEDFKKLIDSDALLEWGEREGVFYGTRKGHDADTGSPQDLVRCTSIAKRRSQYELSQPRTIVLNKGQQGFGFEIIEVAKGERKEFYVSRIDTSGPAARSKQMSEGMQITKINGVNITEDPSGAITALQETESMLNLELRFNPHGYASYQNSLRRESYDRAANIETRMRMLACRNTRVVQLHCSGDGYGIRVSKDDSLGVAFVSELSTDGPAYASSQILKGDM